MEETQQGKGKVFYGWILVAIGTLILAATMGIIFNCFSQFIKPVCEELGFSRKAMSFNQTILALVQVLVAFVWGGIVRRVNLKKLMFCWAIIGPVGFFCYSFCNSIGMFYFISVLMSLTNCFLTVLPFSYIISKWFITKRGIASGICFMGSGLGGMILNPLLGQWLIAFGWRNSFRILAIIMGVVIIPCVLFVKVTPEEKGCKPLGMRDVSLDLSDAAMTEGVTLKEARQMPKFWVLAVSCTLVNIGFTSLVQTLPPHLTDNGYSIAFAATALSIAMGGMAVGKLIVGEIFDRVGARGGALVCATSGLLGLFGMIFCQITPLLGLVILGVGLGCPFGSIATPLIAQHVFGKKDSAAIVGVFIACSNLGGAIGPLANGTVFDAFGSYRPGYCAWAVIMVIALTCFIIYLPKENLKKKVKAN